MNTNYELAEYAARLHIPLVDIVFKDELTRLAPPKRNQGYIVNMQDSKQGFGTHWVAFAIDKNNKAIYFDSFGVLPPLEILDFLQAYKPIQHNDTLEIQDINTGYCGIYCIAFLYYILVLGRTLQSFLAHFSPEEEHNLGILTSLLAIGNPESI